MSNIDPTPYLKDYAFVDKLGSGSYGAVYKAHRKTGIRDVVAIKCVKKSNLSKKEIDNIVTEISLLKKLNHDFIVEMSDFSWDKNYIYINMEYCGGGDLSRFIRAKKKLPENTCHIFLQQLASALKYLRQNNVAHMDLKPQNILLTNVISTKTIRFKGPILKLADFGFASYFLGDQTKSSLRGSPLYMAPEMVLDRKYDAKVDLWSVGVIMFECLFGKAPYKSDTVNELLQKIKLEEQIKIPEIPKLSNSCEDLLARCLQRDPEKRIDFPDFFEHPFLDLEHMPTEESEMKASRIVEQAIKLDRENKFQEAIASYGEALQYWLPLLKNERSNSKRIDLQTKIEKYIQRAEELKRQFMRKPHNDNPRLTNSTTISCEAANSVSCENTVDHLGSNGNHSLETIEDLIHKCSTTPQLKLGLEILLSAESYEKERQYKMALDNYQKGLELMIPLLRTEPKGERKAALTPQIKRWMTKAEAVKELISIQEQVLANSNVEIDSDKTCILQ